ncbi:MAG: two-component system sensor histidine kinase CreC [Gammaproteobacteria bacterium]
MSKRNRILIALFFVFAASVGWLVYGIVKDLEPRYREAAEEPLVDAARILAAVVNTDIRDGVIDPAHLRAAFNDVYRQQFHAQIYALDKTQVDMRVYVTDKMGVVVYDSLGRDEGLNYMKWRDVSLTLQGQYGARTTRNEREDPNSSVMFVGAPLTWNGEIIGELSVGKPTRNLNAFADLAKKKIIIAGLTSVAALVVLGLIAAIWMARPFSLVSDYIRLVRSARDTPFPRLRRSAVGVLGAAYDEMRDALSGRNYVEEYVQALTHELKSPLSAIRGAAELMNEDMPAETRARFLANIRTESERIQNIVDRLLELSALEKKRGLSDLCDIDCAALLEEVKETMSAAAAQRNQTIAIDCPPDVVLSGDRFLLHRALVNLVQNAIDFSPEHAAVSMSAAADKYDVAISVRDSGTGIPDFAEKKVWERFYSLPRANGRKGTGLGLSFVREIAELHRGSVTLENQPQGGVVATLRVPLARS